jgi:hypothetical protein
MNALLLFLLFALNPAQQDQIDLQGFTRSSTEHIINESDAPMVVRSVRGRITMGVERSELSEVLIELRDTNGRIRSTTTGENGEFKLRVPNGSYEFKITRDGFQSIVGKIEVTRKAPKSARVDLNMELGV